MKLNLIAVCLLLAASACSTMTHRGVVAMKISSDQAHVGAGKNDLSVGDHVELYKNICRATNNKNADFDSACVKKLLGHGTVTSLINDDYSVVKFDQGVEFSEGDMIEKHDH
jgi:hypothetical protein